jgi:hypothetical protein
VSQYPATKELQFSTTVLRFTDGAEQRFRQYQAPLRRWIIRLDLLDETELNQVREFFRTHAGASGTFDFTDPWDGTNYTQCSLREDEMKDTLVRESSGLTSLTIRENRG